MDQRKERTINSVDRLGSVYAKMKAEKDGKSRKFKVNLGTILVVVCIVGILAQIL